MRLQLAVSLLPLVCLWVSLDAVWQGTQPSPSAVITADNVRSLHSETYLDFTAIEPSAGEIANGWFVMSSDGGVFGLQNTRGASVAVLAAGDVAARYQPGNEAALSSFPTWTPLDIAISGAGRYAATLYAGETGEVIVLHDMDANQSSVLHPRVRGVNTLSLWFGAEETVLWTEVESSGSFLVECLSWADWECPETTVTQTPQDDSEAIVRLGRIAPPFAVTVTSEGVFRLWNLQMGRIIAEAAGGAVPDIGHLDPSGRYLAWHDPLTGDLYLLDFLTGENQRVGNTGDGYVQTLFVGNHGDVILGVDIGFEPTVAAWIVATGERIELGEYRACGRSPDAIRMSHDGTTLAVGCGGAGIDIWRVRESGR
jgi:hypothetical protein